jgi:hypothetical protein
MPLFMFARANVPDVYFSCRPNIRTIIFAIGIGEALYVTVIAKVSKPRQVLQECPPPSPYTGEGGREKIKETITNP